MPRFALLDHDHPAPHLDLMLEAEGTLWTWRLPSAPEPAAATPAIRLPDHRLLYLDYEGPVSGGRGRVLRRDGGDLAWLEGGEDRVVVRVLGRTLRGRLTLWREEGETWNVLYEPADESVEPPGQRPPGQR